VVNAIAQIDVKPTRLTKQRFVAGSAAAIAVEGGQQWLPPLLPESPIQEVADKALLL